MMNYTTLEQSKKLVELGINPNTADMHYDAMEVIVDKLPQKHIEVYPFVNKHKNTVYECPCWSLGALLKIIPTKIGEKLDYWLTMETTTACNYVLFYKNIYSNEEICISSKNKNPLDSAVDLIKKLTKEGFLNTKGE